MIRVVKKFPCSNCGAESDLKFAYCPYCGAKKPDLGGTEFFNLFSREINAKPEDPFTPVFDGVYLTLDDVKEDIQEFSTQEFDDVYELWVGSYLASSDMVESVDVITWRKVSRDGVLGENEGPRRAPIRHQA